MDFTNEQEERLARFLEGDAEPEEIAALVAEAQADPVLVREMVDLLAVDQWLRDFGTGSDAGFLAGLATRLGVVRGEDDAFVAALGRRLGQRRPGWRGVFPWALAAAVVAVAFALAVWNWAPVQTAPRDADTAAGRGVALLANEFGAEFAEDGAPDAVSFVPGSYHLTAGAAQVRFHNGADVILEAPVKFHIEDGFHLRLVSGSVRALVPPSAKGFTVQVPEARFEDLGTEFGASVDAAAGRSELHVFEGLVEVKPPDKEDLLASVTYGKAVAVDHGVVSSIPTADPRRFATSSTIALRRWEAHRLSLCQDPDLAFYFAFEDGGTHLENSAAFGSAVRGEIHGARWVTGRWPGKKALQFENRGDTVRIDLPGEHAAFTFSSWIKVDRYDHALNALLNSENWTPGKHHWQFNRLGMTAAGSFAGTDRLATPARARLGQWTHVAAVVDGVRGVARYYTNGELAMTEKMPAGTVFQLGRMHVGTWTSPSEDWPPRVRDFRGRVDELIMWRRALTQAEIRALSREGSPHGLLQGALPH